MKTPIKNRFVILIIVLFPLWGSGGLGLVSCSKDDDTPAIEKLPKATQTGAGTFGCLVNGEAFVHNDGLINCYYQYVDGGYYFSITGENDSHKISSINIAAIKKQITEGGTYNLISENKGNITGGIAVGINDVDAVFANTSLNYTGKLTITKLDFENYIVSGTFWFNIEHPITGDTVKIRQGRFDSLFY